MYTRRAMLKAGSKSVKMLHKNAPYESLFLAAMQQLQKVASFEAFRTALATVPVPVREWDKAVAASNADRKTMSAAQPSPAARPADLV